MPPLLVTPGGLGVDEAGRGPLAGPVVAAAVLLPESFDLPGLNDSKRLSRESRERLAEGIVACAEWSVAVVEADEIDRLNILRASLEAMRRAVAGIRAAFEEVWVDGNQTPPGLPAPSRTVVKGDAKIAAIAAASILAKTTRDRLMREAGAAYPGYGFERHLGYPTPDHFRALAEFGPCAIHRRSFAPVRQAEEQPCLGL